jgi:hypothetical protein
MKSNSRFDEANKSFRSAFAASVVKTYEIHIVNQRGDITYNFVDFVIWAALEINIFIIVASIPTLSALFKAKRQARTGYKSHEMYASSGKNSGGAKGIYGHSAPSFVPNSLKSNPKSGGVTVMGTNTSEEDILGQDVRIHKTYDIEIASGPAPEDMRSSGSGTRSERERYPWYDGTRTKQ